MSGEPPVIPDYEPLRRIGRGAYGEVWLARSVTGIYRAVKIVYRTNFEDARPFEREFAGIQRFEPLSRAQENQITILHVGRNEAAGYFYYVMELADDAETAEEISPDKYLPKTLREMRARHTRLPARECLSIGIALTRALVHLHGNGLVHRDIKPSNVVFVHGVPKLADIGLVSAADTSASFVGTEGFVPPEGPGSAAADLYSLGKVLYEISTGRDRKEFPKLPEDFDKLPDKRALLELNEVTAKACDPELARRYASAQAMHDDLLLLQAGKSVKRLRAVERRLQLVAKYGIAATALTLAAAGACLWATIEARKAKENFALSERHRMKAEQALYESELNRARARRMTGVAGRRFDTLQFVRKAAAGTNRLDLRNEAIASLILPDFQAVKKWPKAPDLELELFDSHLRRYFTNDAAGNVIVRDAESDRQLASLPSQGVPVTGAILSGNDRLLAAIGRNNQAWIWNVETRTPVSIDIPKGARLMSFAPDNRAVIVKHADGSFHFLNSASGAEEKVWQGPFALAHISFNASGEVFCGNNKTNVFIHNAIDGTVLMNLPHPETVYAMAWHPDGRRLATSCGKTIHFWDAPTGREIGIAEGHESRIVGLVYGDQGQVLISTCWDHTLRLWQTDTHHELVKSSRAGNNIQMSPDGNRLSFLSWDASLTELWQVANGQEVRRLELPSLVGNIYRTTYQGGFSPDGTLVHLKASDGIHLFDSRSLQRLALLPSTRTLLAGQFHPAGTGFIDGSADGLRLWPFESSGTAGQLRVGPPRPFGSSTFRELLGLSASADGGFLVVNRADGFWVFNVTKPNAVVHSPSPIRLSAAPAISANGQWVASAVEDKTLRIWNARNGEVVTNLKVGAITYSLFSPDNRWLLTATPDEYRFWTIGTWQPGVRLKRSASNSAWLCAAFSPDGTVVALDIAEHTIHLFAAGTDRELAALPTGHFVAHLCFSPDGTQLLMTYEPGRAELWDLRLIRQELAELNLDWEGLAFKSRTSDGSTARSSNRRIISVIVDMNETATAVTQ
jgi:WD40 repeat protein